MIIFNKEMFKISKGYIYIIFFFIYSFFYRHEQDYSIEKILKNYKENTNRQTFNAAAQTKDLDKDSPVKNKKYKSRTAQTDSQPQKDLHKQTNQQTQTKLNGYSANQETQTELTTTPEDSTTTLKENQGIQTELTTTPDDSPTTLKENQGTQTEATTTPEDSTTTQKENQGTQTELTTTPDDSTTNVKENQGTQTEEATRLDDSAEDFESHAVSEVDDFDEFRQLYSTYTLLLIFTFLRFVKANLVEALVITFFVLT